MHPCTLRLKVGEVHACSMRATDFATLTATFRQVQMNNKTLSSFSVVEPTDKGQ